jgi:hypothetical protein
MQQTGIALNDDTANNHVKSAKNEVDVIRNLRLSNPHRRAALTDFNKEAANDLRLAHPFSREKYIAEERDAAAVPFAAEVVGFDAIEIGRSLCGLHSGTSMLAEISSARQETGDAAVSGID